jgi:hypothetical protein
MGSLCFAATGYASRLSPHGARIYLCTGLHACTSTTTSWRSYPPASPHRLATTRRDPALPCPVPEGTDRFGRLAHLDSPGTRLHEHGNINPLSIDYACRPRLRSRLTLGGKTWPRNPWSSGGRVSHSAIATHACILTHTGSTAGSLRRFTARMTLPYPTPPPPGMKPECSRGVAAASAVRLSPATLSAQDHLTSELLRTLSRMAASKPTSWLSGRSHILSHLAHA